MSKKNIPGKNKVPNPGSEKAVNMGCICPILDNSHGYGIAYGVKGSKGKPVFWISENCPLHSEVSKKG